MTRDEAREMLRAAPKAALTIRKGDEDHLAVFIGDSEAQREQWLADTRAQALAAGHVVIHTDGTQEWLTTMADYEADGQHVWHEDGNRIRCGRYLVTVREGVRIEERQRTVWRHFDTYYAD